jgi:hypothetical protein
MNDHTAVDALYRQGVMALEDRRLVEAQNAFKAVLDAQPRHANALYRLGELEQLQGHQPEAAWFYMKTLEADPGHVSARAQLTRLTSANASRISSVRTPTSDLWLPDTDEDFDSFERRATRKKRIELTASWRSFPLPLRVAYLVFAILILAAFVAIMGTVIGSIPS